MDALEAVGDDRAYAEQARAFGGPVARAAGSVFLTGDHDQRHFLLRIAHRGIVDAHLLAARLVDGYSTFDARDHLIPEANVGERAAHHDFVVHAPRAVVVEVG